MHIYISIESLLKMSLESYFERVVSYLTTSGSNCVNPVIATYFLSQKRVASGINPAEGYALISCARRMEK